MFDMVILIFHANALDPSPDQIFRLALYDVYYLKSGSYFKISVPEERNLRKKGKLYTAVLHCFPFIIFLYLCFALNVEGSKLITPTHIQIQTNKIGSRDSNGISKLPLKQLLLPYRISRIRVCLKIPLLSLIGRPKPPSH